MRLPCHWERRLRSERWSFAPIPPLPRDASGSRAGALQEGINLISARGKGPSGAPRTLSTLDCRDDPLPGG